MPDATGVMQAVGSLARRVEDFLADIEVRLENGLREAFRLAESACETRLAPLEKLFEEGQRSVQELEERVQHLSAAKVAQMDADSKMAEAKGQPEVYAIIGSVVGDIERLRESCNSNAAKIEEMRGRSEPQARTQGPEALQDLEDRIQTNLEFLEEQQLRIRTELSSLQTQQQDGLSQEVWGQLALAARAAVQSEVGSELRALQSRLAADTQALQEQQAHFGLSLGEMQGQQSAVAEALRLMQELALRQGSDLETLKSLYNGEMRQPPGGGTGEPGQAIAIAAEGPQGPRNNRSTTRSPSCPTLPGVAEDEPSEAASNTMQPQDGTEQNVPGAYMLRQLRGATLEALRAPANLGQRQPTIDEARIVH